MYAQHITEEQREVIRVALEMYESCENKQGRRREPHRQHGTRRRDRRERTRRRMN